MVQLRLFRFLLVAALFAMSLPEALAQYRRRATPTPPPRAATTQPTRAAATQPMRKPSDLIHKQDPISINQQLLAQVSPDDVRIFVSIPKQRALLLKGDEVVIDSPISSGKRGHSSPTGKFSVLEKDKNHHSTLYGDFRDSHGRIVRGGVSARIDSAPSGTRFVGAEMRWFMRLTGDGVGMHVGILPGYPASHGCIRMPSQAAELFYAHVKVGTLVEVQPP
jgi:lipoprotein-anchoring transpeptidase ErfK/SrfK